MSRDTTVAGNRNALLLRLAVILALVTVAVLLRARLLDTDLRSPQSVLPVEIVEQRREREEPEEPEPPPPEQDTEIPDQQAIEMLAAIPDLPADSLGLDATGGSGGDGFGLRARPGGRALTERGGGSGSGDRLEALRRYAGLLRADLLRALETLEALRSADYTIVCRLWLDSKGNVERAELGESTGSREFDAIIARQLESVRNLPRPPRGLPQPISIRLTTSGSGRAAVARDS